MSLAHREAVKRAQLLILGILTLGGLAHANPPPDDLIVDKDPKMGTDPKTGCAILKGSSGSWSTSKDCKVVLPPRQKPQPYQKPGLAHRASEQDETSIKDGLLPTSPMPPPPEHQSAAGEGWVLPVKCVYRLRGPQYWAETLEQFRARIAKDSDCVFVEATHEQLRRPLPAHPPKPAGPSSAE